MKSLRAFALLFLMTTAAALAADAWQEKVRKELPLLGHRNWIVVADAAYPLQTSAGIETIYVEADLLEVVKGVLSQLEKTRHIKPTIFTDAETRFVAEKSAPGISAYRAGLAKLLENRSVEVLPHEQIIGRLDEAGRTFKVLLIKTPLTIPYTSVFFRLECGYWNAESERQLREAMAGQK